MVKGCTTCLLRIATADSRLYMQWHSYYMSDQYPLRGGLLEQPCKYLDAMTVLNNVHAEVKE